MGSSHLPFPVRPNDRRFLPRAAHNAVSAIGVSEPTFMGLWLPDKEIGHNLTIDHRPQAARILQAVHRARRPRSNAPRHFHIATDRRLIRPQRALRRCCTSAGLVGSCFRQ